MSLHELYPNPRSRRQEAGFTLMELMFASALLTAFAVVSILAFTTFNRFASNARYESLALAVAQEKMDEILTSVCNINSTVTLGPTLTLSGTTVSPNSSDVYPSISETNLALNNDKYNLTRTINSGSALTLLLSGTIYAGAEDTQVIDTRTTTFTAVSGNVREMTVNITVAYTYRGNQFTVTLSSIRASDNF